MSDVQIFWDPSGIELDSLGSKQYLRTTDGDTPFISVSIRMLSIDTPEVHYPGNTKPSKHDEKLKQLADWIQQGKAPISNGLAAFLHPRLAAGNAGSLQEEQGKKATEFFKDLVEQKLSRPNGSKRTVFIAVGDQPFDEYGRLLAYMAPNYSAEERAGMTREERATFNLLMVASGWAAPFPIYPSLPCHSDLELLQEAGKWALEHQKGAWDEPLMLTGYEFRSAYRLYEITSQLVKGKKLSTREREAWIYRYCLDMTTREIFYPQNYYKVAPYNRIFVWPENVTEAVANLNLLPGK
jgi:endonuclease YncB( thermonuclease family)